MKRKTDMVRMIIRMMATVEPISLFLIDSMIPLMYSMDVFTWSIPSISVVGLWQPWHAGAFLMSEIEVNVRRLSIIVESSRLKTDMSCLGTDVPISAGLAEFSMVPSGSRILIDVICPELLRRESIDLTSSDLPVRIASEMLLLIVSLRSWMLPSVIL